MAFIMKQQSPLKVRKTKKGLALKRWFKEEWKDEDGNVCGSDKKKTKVCRPSKRVSKDSPKPWKEMTKAEKASSARRKTGPKRVAHAVTASGRRRKTTRNA